MGVIRGWAEEYLARADVDERKTVGNSRPEGRDHALGEEVACDKRVHVDPDESLSVGLSCLPSAQGRGCQSFTLQDPPDRGSSELESKLPELADDTPVAPARVLRGQTDDQFAHVTGDPRPADAFPPSPFPQLP